MQTVTIPEVWVLIVSICTGIISIVKVVELCKKLTGKEALSKRITALETRMGATELAITALETARVDADKAQGVMFRAMLSMLGHLRTGNGVEKLKDSEDEIQRYLTEQ